MRCSGISVSFAGSRPISSSNGAKKSTFPWVRSPRSELTSVLEVRFKGNRREYFTWPSADSSPLRLDVPVIVEVERGQDFGVISALGEIAAKKCERCGACGGSGLGTRDSGLPEPRTPKVHRPHRHQRRPQDGHGPAR